MRSQVEELLFVVAAHQDGARSTHDVEDASRIRSARDDIAHENELISAGEGYPVEQLFELLPASVNVSDDDRSFRPTAARARAPCNALVRCACTAGS